MHAGEQVISVKLFVDSSHHLAPWTWKRANPGATQHPRCHSATDTVPTSHHVPFHRWHFAHHSPCQLTGSVTEHFPYCLCQWLWRLLRHLGNMS